MIRPSHAGVIKLLKIFLFVVLTACCLYALGRLTRLNRGDSPGTRRPSGTTSDAMDVGQACAVLGLAEQGLNQADVVSTHRRLMQHLHPDKGGSALLAQQLNEAKRVLLQHL